MIKTRMTDLPGELKKGSRGCIDDVVDGGRMAGHMVAHVLRDFALRKGSRRSAVAGVCVCVRRLVSAGLYRRFSQINAPVLTFSYACNAG